MSESGAESANHAKDSKNENKHDTPPPHLEDECRSIAEALRTQRAQEAGKNTQTSTTTKNADDAARVLQSLRAQREQCIARLENSMSCIENMLNEIAEDLQTAKDEMRRDW